MAQATENVPLTKTAHPQNAGAVLAAIEFATDPLCCWSWVMQPQWQKLREDFAGRVAWRYRMATMISDWDAYNDPVNSVARPAQMAPLWIQAAQVTGMDIDAHIWTEDPPASSVPACIAVKAAGLQSALAGALLLHRLQQAVMTECRNIAKQEIILELATEIREIEIVRFKKDLNSTEASRALKEDMKELRYRGIERYPALTVSTPDHKGFTLTGYQPYNNLRAAILAVAPELEL